jgi:hypothetical protein
MREKIERAFFIPIPEIVGVRNPEEKEPHLIAVGGAGKDYRSMSMHR